LPQAVEASEASFPPSMAPEVLLGPNDVIQVVIPMHPELVNEHGYRVTAAGSIILPLCGAVHVAGYGLEKAEQGIRTALSEYLKNPSVGLSVMERGAQQVHLLGQVKSPGVLVLDRPTSALEALAHAGGFELGARRDRVAIIRRESDGGCAVYFFDGETPGAEGMRWLHPGDVVFVPRSGVGVFRDEVLPILHGIGFVTSQITAVAIIAETF
jgi:protein involved in polysaccharide export with SLBB domain